MGSIVDVLQHPWMKRVLFALHGLVLFAEAVH